MVREIVDPILGQNCTKAVTNRDLQMLQLQEMILLLQLKSPTL